MPEPKIGPDGKARDENGNLVPREQIKGRVLNGECGHFGCTIRPASMFDNDRSIFVCAACAAEQNDRARRIHGRDASIPCAAPPASAVKVFADEVDPWPDFVALGTGYPE